MKLLAVDTSTDACSAALLIDGEISLQYQLAPRQHSHLILGMVEVLLSQAALKVDDIDVLAFGRGPGSFMGVRIAAGVVQGLAFAHSIPIVPVSTLAAIAHHAIEKSGETQAIAMIDARMDEVYWGIYKSGTSKSGQDRTSETLKLVGRECVTKPEDVTFPASESWIAAGTGWLAYRDRFDVKTDYNFEVETGICYPSATSIAKLAVSRFQEGDYISAAEAVPVYIRDNVARKPGAAV